MVTERSKKWAKKGGILRSSFGLLKMIPKPQSRLFVHNCIVGERNMFIDMHLVNNEIAMKSYKYLNCCSKQITKYTNSTHLEIDSFSDSFLSSKKLLTGSIFHRGKWLFLLQIKEWEDMSGQSCNSIKVRPFSKGSNKKKSRTKVFYSMHHFPSICVHLLSSKKI